jgi:hypothetical protein
MGDLNTSWRCFYNVYDYNDGAAGFKPWEAAYTTFEKKMQDRLEMEPEELLPWSLEEGNTIEFWAAEKAIGGGRSYNEPQIPEFFPRDPYPESILDEVIAFDKYVKFSTYDEIAADHFGMEQVQSSATGVADQRPDESPFHEDPSPRGRTRGTSRARQTQEPDPAPATRPRQRGSATRQSTSDACPWNHEFGTDCNNQPECADCPDNSFDACVKAQDQAVSSGSNRPEPEPTPTRRRRGAAAAEPEQQTRRRTSAPAQDQEPAPTGGRRRRRS